MSKLTLNSLVSGYLSIAQMNQNFADIVSEFQNKALYRDNPVGEPNSMQNDFDMNSNRILNLTSPIADSEPARWIDVKNGVNTSDTVMPSFTSNEKKFLSTDGAALVFKDTEDLLYNHGGTGAVAQDTADKLREVVSVKDFGAVGDNSTDDHAAILAALDYLKSVNGGRLLFPFATYKITDRFVLDSTYSNIDIDLGGSTVNLVSATAIAVFYVPAVGDGDAGIAGADGLTIRNCILDGTNATLGKAGIKCYDGEGQTFRNIESNNWGLTGLWINGVVSGSISVLVDNFRGTGNTNHGIAVSTVEVDASRVVFQNIWSHTNGLGIDISTGSATLTNANCWNNTNGGMKTAGNDNQHLIVSNCDLSNNTAASAHGFYTNGTFRLIEMNNVRSRNNGGNGFSIAHAGIFLGSNLYADSCTIQGFLQSGAATSILNNLYAGRNTERGLTVTAGDCQVSSLYTELNEREGVLVTTTGRFQLSQHTSIDDCNTSGNSSVALTPAAPGSFYQVSSLMSIDTRGTPKVVIGLELGVNVVNCFASSIKIAGVTTAISDGGTDTVYFDSAGDTRIGISTSGLGFFGTAPIGKPTVTGSRGANAALASTLTALANLGLLTDSSTV